MKRVLDHPRWADWRILLDFGALAILLASLLSACGGGGGSVAPSPPPPPPALGITTTTLPNAVEDDDAYTATVQATGGTAPFTWSISAGNLPSGLTPDGSTTSTLGFTGGPTAGGSFDFTVQVRDSGSPAQTASQAYTVAVLEVTTTGLADGVQNDAYNAGLSVVGEVPTVTWDEPGGVLGTGVCAGLALDANSGVVSGTPTNFGTCGPFTINATDSDSPARTDTQTLSIDIVEELQITTTSLPGGTVGIAYSQSITATGGTAPFTWSETTGAFDEVTGQGLSATACQGLTLDVNATGSSTTLAGTPDNGGTCTFTVRVEDSGVPSQFDTQSFSFDITPGILTITTTDLPDGAVNRSYSQTVEATGGTAPFSWAVTVGVLPSGLSLNTSTGEISGSPDTEETQAFTVEVTDSAAAPQTDTQNLSITIGPEPAAGRNDTVATATDLGNTPAVGDTSTFLASISPFGEVVVGVTPNPADNDFYRLAAPAGADLSIEVVARRLVNASQLDSVIELVTDDGSDLGARVLAACRESGDDPDSTTGTVNGVDGSVDLTPNDFDDDCINDDIVLGVIRDSRLEFRVPSGAGDPDPFPFFIRVLDWRGDARPDLLYELVITRVN